MKLADYQQPLLPVLLQQATPQTLNADWFNAPSPLDARLAIYQASSLGGRVAALQQVFSSVQRLVGETYFVQMVEAFIAQNPSQHFAINRIGERFAAYILEHEVMQHVPYAAEMASFDWAWHEVFHGPNNAPLQATDSQTDLQAIGGAHCLAADYPLHLIWEMCQPEYQGDFMLPEKTQRWHILLLQTEQRIEIKLLTAAQQRMLSLLSQPCSFSTLTAAYVQKFEAALPLPDWQQLCAMGLVVASE
jgi:hypothetical protein